MKIAQKIIASLLLFFCISLPCSALHLTEQKSHSTLHLLTDVDTIKSGDSFWVMFHVALKPGWYTYWENPGEAGLAPKLETELPSGVKAAPLQFLPPSILHVADMVEYGYQNDAYYLIHVQTQKSFKQNTLNATFTFNWVVCEDVCVPQSSVLQLALPQGPHTLQSPESDLILPKVNAWQDIPSYPVEIKTTEHQMAITVPTHGKSVKAPYIFVSPKGSVKAGEPQTWKHEGSTLIFDLQRDEPDVFVQNGLVKLNQQDYIRFESHSDLLSEKHFNPSFSFLTALFFAFLGGVLLNIMPCVFPILTLKIVSLAKQKGKLAHQRAFHGLVYTLGILIAFLILATLIVSLQQTGMMVGWGFQMQSPAFLTIMTYVLFLVAMNLFGLVEFIIPLPIGHEEHPYSLKSSFMAGLLITLIATPCTAPFMAPAIGFALTQPMLVIYGVFIALALGLACPFLIISILPHLIAHIPKPGLWLIHFKQILAFPMLLSAVWLLWILMKTSSPNFVGAVMIGMTAIGFYLWFNHTYKKSKLRNRFIVLMTTAFLVFLPFTISSFKEATPAQVFKRSELDNFIEHHRPVLVNVTADWCITCKVNETLVFENAEVQSYLQNNKIAFYKVDWTKPNAEIAEYLQQFGRSGVPMVVFYRNTGDPMLLPQILTKQIFLDAIKN